MENWQVFIIILSFAGTILTAIVINWPANEYVEQVKAESERTRQLGKSITGK